MTNAMKKIGALVLVLAMVCAFTACAATLRGTYVAKDGLIDQSFTFKEDNVVEFSALGLDIEGDYVIEDGEIIITYSLLGISKDMSFSFEKKGDTIIIDGTEFVKEK